MNYKSVKSAGFDLSSIRDKKAANQLATEQYREAYVAWGKPLEKFKQDLFNTIPTFVRNYFNDGKSQLEIETSNYTYKDVPKVTVKVSGNARKDSMSWTFNLSASNDGSSGTNEMKIKKSTGNSSMGDGFANTPEKVAELGEMLEVLNWLTEAGEAWISNAWEAASKSLIDSYGFKPDEKPVSPERFSESSELRELRTRKFETLLTNPEDFRYIGKYSWTKLGDEFRVIKQTPKTVTIETRKAPDSPWTGDIPPIKLDRLSDNFEPAYEIDFTLEDVLELPNLFETKGTARFSNIEVEDGIAKLTKYDEDDIILNDDNLKEYVELRG